MLGTALAEAQRARAAAGKRASQALARLGQALAERAGELDLGPLDDPLRAVARARAEAEQLRATEEEAAADAEARRAELQREVEQASKEADPWRDRETKLRTQLEARQHDARRGEAQARRAEIELRNARSTRADEERTALLESDLAARRSELELAQQKVRELTAELGQARRELATRLGRVATLTEEQKRSESALEKASRVHGSAGRQARQSLEEAYETLGRYALERGYGQAAPDHVEAARTAWAELERRRRAALLYERARLAYDRDAFRRGSIVVGSAAGVILAAIVVAIAV
jgi:DNA repair exonuclease SbcCD ATPase subunit